MEQEKTAETARTQQQIAARIGSRALLCAEQQLLYLEQRVKRNAQNAKICERLLCALDGDAALRGIETADEPTQNARLLEDDERKRITELLRQHAVMSDSDAARCAVTMVDLAAKLSERLGGADGEDEGSPLVEISAVQPMDAPQPEIILNGEAVYEAH